MDITNGYRRSVFMFQSMFQESQVKSMVIQVSYHLIDAISYFASFIVPFYFILKSRTQNIEYDTIVKLMILLASFMLIQFIYHIAALFDLKLISKGIFEPISAGVFTIFAIIYYFSTRKIKRGEEKEEAGI